MEKIDMEVADDLFIDDVLSSADGSEIMRRSWMSVRLALIELQARRKSEKQKRETYDKELAGA